MGVMNKRIAIACGGTGGHIHPALAVADRLRAEGAELSLILSGTRQAEAPTAAAWQGPLLKSGARPIRDPRNLLAVLRCLRFLRRERPAVLFATGGYTSFAPVVAARLLKIPVVLHEANSLPGKAVRWLSRHLRVEAVATSFPESAAKLPWAKCVQTGLPLRQGVLDALARAQAVEKAEGQLTVLVTGGSQGARGMNRLVAPILASLAQSDPKVRIIHQCGAADCEEMARVYAATPGQVTIAPFLEDMGTAYGQADFVIARAGAATCFEIAACAVPAILIPLPTAAEHHQHVNAQALVRSGGALLFDQITGEPHQLAEAIRQLYSDPLLRKMMHQALADLPRPDAAGACAALIWRTVNGEQ